MASSELSQDRVNCGGHGLAHINNQLLNDAILHLFLPKKTPIKLQTNLQEIENFLLEVFSDGISYALNKYHITQLNSTKKMFQKWKSHQLLKDISKQRRKVCHEILTLSDGSTLPIYIRQQNCTLLITKNNEEFTISTFRSALPAKMVMSSVGWHSVHFPETIETIRNKDLLKSKIFGKLLLELSLENVDEIVLEKTSKGEHEYSETRDVANPHLVQDWIAGLLVPIATKYGQNNLNIQKKIRDQVMLTATTGSSKTMPFRRSGMYMSLKVTLQLNILETLEEKDVSIYVYKILILKMLTNVVDRLCNWNQERSKIDMDLCSQILAKLGRRVRKLETLSLFANLESTDKMSMQIINLRDKCLEQTEVIVSRLHEQMQKFWNNEVINILGKEEVIDNYLSKSTVENNDLCHEMTALNNYIDKLYKIFAKQENNTCNSIVQLPHFERYVSFADIDSSFDHLYTETEKRTWLYDTENFIKFKRHESRIKASIISELVRKYLSIAPQFYNNNPLGMSQILLVALKGLHILDKFVTNLYPLLLEYKMEINTEAFNYLILPFRKDMDLLNEMLHYFKFRENNARYPGILENIPTPNSFSARFGEANDQVQKMRQRILKDTDELIEKKYIELDSVRKECLQLQKLVREPCKCEYKVHKYKDEDGRHCEEKTKVFECTSCESEYPLRKTRRSVAFLERPLPSETHLQNAVLFEVLQPKQFTIYRDYLAYFKCLVLGEEIFSRTKIAFKWLEYDKLRKYANNKKDPNPLLGSTSYPVLGTHCFKMKLDLLHSTNNEKYILKNGMNCIFNYTNEGKLTESWKTSCSFKINSASNFEPYSNLQEYLDSTNHFQNDVIAKQNLCHEKLSLQEFIAFGSLRAGHRIQLRNLYEAIFSGSLSLEEEPVLALVLQTIWQVGPRDTDNNAESHFDFWDYDFAEEYLEMLYKLAQTNKENYGNTFTMLIAVMITSRISELNDHLEDNCYDLLKMLRKFLGNWIIKIDMKLRKPEVVVEVQDGTNSLRKNLFAVVLSLLFSFSVTDQNDLTKVIRDEEDIVHWFETIYQYNQLEEYAVDKSEFLKIIVHFCKLVPLRLNLQSKFQNPDSKSLFEKSFYSFVSKKWSKDILFTQKRIELLENCNIIRANYLDQNNRKYQVTFDLILGTFLINGYCQSQLPIGIRNNKLFQWYFKDTLNLRIQQESIKLVRTVTKFQGKHYEFHGQFDDNDEIIIREIHDNGTSLVLLNTENLVNQVSDYFLNNYTHWLDVETKIVYFRTRVSRGKDFGNEYNYKLVKLQKSQNWRFLDVLKSKFILSICSYGFLEFCSILENFELPEYINILQDKDGMKTAYLRRYNLRFTLKPNSKNLPESLEYPGYFIAKCKLRFGTLIGLQHGMLLENGERRMLLVPHSEILVTSEVHHQKVTIFLETLREPPCFDYEFDDVLQRLKARNNKSAWLYLAALHAVTSSSLPDPFTEVTGTEMAARILQSACVWSCCPYNEGSLKILKFIHGLSPKRYYYGNVSEELGSMEHINWPEDISSLVAYDGFAIIVEKLILDSEKLASLYDRMSNTDISWITDASSSELLRIRAYHQNLCFYNDALSVQKPHYFKSSQLTLLENLEKSEKLDIRSSPGNFNLSHSTMVSFSQLTKHISLFQTCGDFQKDTLLPFLLTDEPLDIPISKPWLKGQGVFNDLLVNFDFRYNWFKIYNLAIRCGKSKEDQICFSTVLSTLAYSGSASMEQIANLHCISLMTTENTNIIFPVIQHDQVGIYDDPTQNDFEVGIVKNILSDHVKPFWEKCPDEPKMKSVTETKQYEQKMEKYNRKLKIYTERKLAYENNMQKHCGNLALSLNSKFWPCAKIQEDQITYLLEPLKSLVKPALAEINEKFKFWYRNYELKLFIESVQQILNDSCDYIESGKFKESSSSFNEGNLEPDVSVAVIKKDTEQNLLNGCELFDPNLATNREETKKIFESGNFNTIKHRKYNLKRQQKILEKKIKEVRNEIFKMMTGNIYKRIVSKTGISPGLDPANVLSLLSSSPLGYQNAIVDYAGALAVLWCKLKKLNRCIRSSNDDFLEVSSSGHETWSPKNCPDWLLLELELDIMIRPIQVDVAKQMMNMTNGVTQLNMGQGKTSVIVPMLCASLAKSNIQLCRVTVLSSMFNMNLNSLTFAIGGLLNRRVYWIPCRRDLKIDENVVTSIMDAYKECLDKRGIVLTLPEYRLSFRLLAYDKMYKEEGDLGQNMLEIENWLRKYARDVLDESDELFNAKYQLVYTIGTQVALDGGNMRWSTCQKILSYIPKIAKILILKYSTSMVEFDLLEHARYPHQFSTFRLLGDANCTETFMELLADKILEEKRLTKTERVIVKHFLTDSRVPEEDHKKVISSIFTDNPDELKNTLLISGYLRRGVLGLALQKRWRVEYGVNPKQGFRRMAVPFRAKDVAAEKTEFGHPDQAIILTHLSYYYSGLDDNQLQEVFDILKGKQAPEDIYSEWLSDIPEGMIPHFLVKYHIINMKDAYQKSCLFQMLRKHKMVIDFWLSHCVFPRESKQFPGKLVMTSWDLCYERQQFPVTGFSGTNDSKILLPLMITQQDLPELEDTNQKMEMTLLQPENQNHRGFPMGVTCGTILESMKSDNLTILIDAGALMLECSNEQVAILWLEINPEIEAAVYFSKDNNLLVKCRGDKGPGTPFDVSPYQGRLEKCGVFLDDQHTRGTDLKFPVGVKACVTIATRMKRDKLIQACMRMRKLGQGHSVTFYVSHEAKDKILSGVMDDNPEITTRLILDWVLKNTEESNNDGLLYWAQAGRNYAQRLAAEDNFHWPCIQTPLAVDTDNPKLKEKAKVLAKQCVDDEVMKLMDMYGQFTQVEFLHQLIPQWFAITKRKLQRKNEGTEMNPEIIKRFDEIGEAVRMKILQHVPDKMQVSSNSGMMEEEQEKELELEKETEVEEERQVERPRNADPVRPSLHPNVQSIILHGTPPEGEKKMEGIAKLPEIFKATTFYKEVQPSCWDSRVFVTNDFMKTIEGPSLYYKTDSFLRPIQYLVSIKTRNNTGDVDIIVISSFEANELIPYFRNGQANSKLHMFSPRKSAKQDLLVNKGGLQVPSAEDTVVILREDGSLLASLLLASGSLYFISMEEQKAFVRFLGIVPQPWSEEEKEAFEEGMITKSGFVIPRYRKLLMALSSLQDDGFQRDPTELVKMILKCRHAVVSDVTHVWRLIEEKRYIEMP